MKRALLWLALPLLFSTGCGKPAEAPADAGVDSSCGIDCAVQGRYGLIAERCFEYSSSTTAQDPADLGALVRPVQDLESVRVLPVEYWRSGQILMTDFFLLDGGALRLARRSFGAGHSVTYRDEPGGITGVTWLEAQTGAGQSLVSSAVAEVLQNARTSEPTTLRVNTAQASTAEATVPAGNHPGLTLLFFETPEHGLDRRRVFVEGLGFTLFSSCLAQGSCAAAREYRLQRVRDIGTQDAGAEPCGLGRP